MTEIEVMLRFPIGSYCRCVSAAGPIALVAKVVGYQLVGTNAVPYYNPAILIVYPNNKHVYPRDPRHFIPCDPPPDGAECVTVARGRSHD
jgi:hypothetical protein